MPRTTQSSSARSVRKRGAIAGASSARGDFSVTVPRLCGRHCHTPSVKPGSVSGTPMRPSAQETGPPLICTSGASSPSCVRAKSDIMPGDQVSTPLPVVAQRSTSHARRGQTMRRFADQR